MRLHAWGLAVSLVFLASSVSAICPAIPGDVAPGALGNATVPPTWTPVGDGNISVSDVVALVRARLGLHAIAWAPAVASSCPALPGDISPSTSDPTTTPPACFAIGDGWIDNADVAQALMIALNTCSLPPAPDELLTDAQVAVLDALPDGPPSLAGVVLPDGRTLADSGEPGVLPAVPGDAANQAAGCALSISSPAPLPDIACSESYGDSSACKMSIIEYMVRQAEIYVNRSSWQVEADGPDAPAQSGLAYSFGQKNPCTRAVQPCDRNYNCPGRNTPGICPERLCGLDCSGLVYRCALAAGLAIPSYDANVAWESSTDMWNAIIPDAWPVTMERVNDGSLQTGDLVFWPRHVGIIQVQGGTTYVLQCNGTPGPDAVECAKNHGPSRGPRKLNLAGMTTEPVWGQPTAVLRFRAAPACPNAPNVCIEGHVVQCFRYDCFSPGAAPVCTNCFSVPTNPGGCYYVLGRNEGVADVVVSTSLDSETATTDENGHFVLETATPISEALSNQPYVIYINGRGEAPYGWGATPTGQLFTVGDPPSCDP